ncbi:MAG TPA: hypothetical protein VJ995_00675 [Geothermobacteraceae bacterium]|nr:hypothetical protein [Geothermobacteraceae bacterium]
MSRLIICCLLIITGAISACSAAIQAQSSTVQDGSFYLDGTVVYVQLEGGFYGLLDSQGARYDPDQMPAEFRIDGLAVRTRLAPLPPSVGFHMWGKKVHLISIERR